MDYARYTWTLFCKGLDILRFEHLEEGDFWNLFSVHTKAKYKKANGLIFFLSGLRTMKMHTYK